MTCRVKRLVEGLIAFLADAAAGLAGRAAAELRDCAQDVNEAIAQAERDQARWDAKRPAR